MGVHCVSVNLRARVRLESAVSSPHEERALEPPSASVIASRAVDVLSRSFGAEKRFSHTSVVLCPSAAMASDPFHTCSYRTHPREWPSLRGVYLLQVIRLLE